MKGLETTPFLIVIADVWCGTGGGTSLDAGLVVLGGEGARDASSRAPFVVVVEPLSSSSSSPFHFRFPLSGMTKYKIKKVNSIEKRTRKKKTHL